MEKQETSLDAVLQQLFEDHYVPFMGCTLILSQLPNAAVCAVRGVFLKAIDLPEAAWSPGWFFSEMLKVAPNSVVLEGYAPTGLNCMLNNYPKLC